MAQKIDFLKGSLEVFYVKNCMPQMMLQLLRIIYSKRQIQWGFFVLNPRVPYSATAAAELWIPGRLIEATCSTLSMTVGCQPIW